MTWVPKPPNLSDKLADWQALSDVGGEDLTRDKDVLDVGAEYGLDAMLLAYRSRSYVAVDNSAEVLDHLKACTPTKVSVRYMDATERWPYDDGSFDTVLDFSAFDDTANPEHCYREAARVLRVGGHLVSSFANAAVIEDDRAGKRQTHEGLSQLARLLCLDVINAQRHDKPRGVIVMEKRGNLIPTDRERGFWRCASQFPADKEGVYAGHSQAHEFDENAGKQVLEYGCGGGSDAMSFLRRGCEVWFSDIVPDNVTTASGRIASAGLAERAHPLVLQASDVLPLENASVDVVSSHGVLHHIKDPFPVLKEMHRVLKPGGRIYVMLYTEILRHEADGAVSRVCQDNPGVSPQEAFAWYTDDRGAPWADNYTEAQGWELLEMAGFARRDVYMTNKDRFRTFRGTKS